MINGSVYCKAIHALNPFPSSYPMIQALAQVTNLESNDAVAVHIMARLCFARGAVVTLFCWHHYFQRYSNSDREFIDNNYCFVCPPWADNGGSGRCFHFEAPPFTFDLNPFGAKCYVFILLSKFPCIFNPRSIVGWG